MRHIIGYDSHHAANFALGHRGWAEKPWRGFPGPIHALSQLDLPGIEPSTPCFFGWKLEGIDTDTGNPTSVQHHLTTSSKARLVYAYNTGYATTPPVCVPVTITVLPFTLTVFQLTLSWWLSAALGYLVNVIATIILFIEFLSLLQHIHACLYRKYKRKLSHVHVYVVCLKRFWKGSRCKKQYFNFLRQVFISFPDVLFRFAQKLRLFLVTAEREGRQYPDKTKQSFQ